MSVTSLIDDIIQREGGVSNDADDAGGLTNFGITQATLSQYLGRPASDDEVRNLDRSVAFDIYLKRYYRDPGFDAIEDPEVQELAVDYGVNSGPGQAIKSLQTCLQRMGLYTGAIDGGIGPMTRQALRAVKNWPELFYRLKCERYELFLRYIGHDPRQSKFATGWANRMDTLEDKS
jgi:lysozyme family protein